MKVLLEAARGDKLEALYVLAITTGMRQGELLGLQWKEVNLDAGTLRVNRSVYEGVISPPKTSAGRRTIRLSKLAVSGIGLDPLWWTPESLEAKPPGSPHAEEYLVPLHRGVQGRGGSAGPFLSRKIHPPARLRDRRSIPDAP